MFIYMLKGAIAVLMLSAIKKVCGVLNIESHAIEKTYFHSKALFSEEVIYYSYGYINRVCFPQYFLPIDVSWGGFAIKLHEIIYFFSKRYHITPIVIFSITFP